MATDKNKTSRSLKVSKSRSHKVAVYGGTFDPVHKGHIAIARNVSMLFDLDEVLFIPAFVAPHKRDVKPSSAWHRYAMLALATEDEKKFKISTIELDAPEKPFTIQTLSTIEEILGERVQMFFIMGADSWVDIKTWRDWETLLTTRNHIVVTRPNYELDTRHVTDEVRERVIDVRGKEKILVSENETKIYVTDAVQMDVSASAIRMGIREGKEDWYSDVSDNVAEYIKKYRLYQKI